MSIIKGQPAPSSISITESVSDSFCEGFFLHDDGRRFYLDAYCIEADVDVVRAELVDRFTAEANKWERYYDSISGALNLGR